MESFQKFPPLCNPAIWYLIPALAMLKVCLSMSIFLKHDLTCCSDYNCNVWMQQKPARPSAPEGWVCPKPWGINCPHLPFVLVTPDPAGGVRGTSWPQKGWMVQQKGRIWLATREPPSNLRQLLHVCKAREYYLSLHRHITASVSHNTNTYLAGKLQDDRQFLSNGRLIGCVAWRMLLLNE